MSDELRAAVADLIECVKPNDNAAGPWLAKPASDGVTCYLLGPRLTTRPARTVVGEITLDSFPDERPKRAERVATAIVAIINAALAARPDDDGEPADSAWLEAVVPGYRSVGGVMGDAWRLTAHRQSTGAVAVTLVTDDATLNRRCRTRGHVRALFRALDIPLAEGPQS